MRPTFLPVIAVAAVFSLTATLASEPAPFARTKQEFIEQLTPRIKTRGLAIGVGTEPAEPEAPQRSFVRVEFDFDSAALRPEARDVLDELGEALRSQELVAYRFRVTGHTDGVGTAAYNQALSERRAASVSSYLTRQFDIPPQRLEVEGKGMSELLVPEDPHSAVNRRVEITNLGR